MPQFQNPNISMNVFDGNKKQSHRRGKPENDNIKVKFIIDSKAKVIGFGDSLVKYLRWEELSSKKNNVRVVTHPGSTTKDVFDYIKSIVRTNSDTLIIHTGTCDLTNVNAMKKIRKLVKVVCEIDESEKN